MNQEALKQILSTRYDRASWQSVLTDVFGVRELQQSPRSIPLPKNEIAASAVELGSVETTDTRLVGIYEVELTDKPRIWQNRVGLRQLLRNVYSGDVDAALVVFVQAEKWRLSLISEIKSVDNETGEVVEQKTEPKRYTYLLGKGETVRTPVERLVDFQTSDRKIDTLIKAFSVEALNKDFFREYKVVFDTLAKEAGLQVTDDETARLFAQRLLNRLMFLYFIQKKGWMIFQGDSNYLRRIFDEAVRRKQKFYSDRLYYVFFYGLSNHAESKEIHNQKELEEIRGTVPYLNGGLFELEKDGLDEKGKVPISNDRFREILELFERYNFTIDESTPFEVQVAVDPEMLGKVFEELVTGRHESGSYYTPRTVVSFMCREALKHALEGIESPETTAKLVDENDGRSVRNPEKVLGRLRELKVCDPACGSGAYLLGMLQELLHIREALFSSTAIAKDAQYKWKREIIENNIYGVDLDRFATQIASLRLWLSLAIESEEPKALPNLKYKIGCGDSLLAPLETDLQPDLHRRALIEQFRARKKEYTDADNYLEKQDAEDEIERLRVEIARTLHHLPEPPSPAKLILARNSVGLIQTKIDDAIQRFDKAAIEKHSRALAALNGDIAKMEAEQSVAHYETGNIFDWAVEFAEVFEESGFNIVLANPPYLSTKHGFGRDNREALSQVYSTAVGQFDAYALFIERAFSLMSPNGVYAYIVPKPILTNSNMATVRNLMYEHSVSAIMDPGTVFDAGVEPIVIVGCQSPVLDTQVRIFSHVGFERFLQISEMITPSGYWNLNGVPSHISSLPNLRKFGDLYDITRGVECGKRDASIRTSSDEGNSHPLLRGEDVSRYVVESPGIFIIRSGDERKFKPLALYTSPKLLIRRVSNRIIAAVDESGAHVLNTVYVAVPRSLGISPWATCAVLNSKTTDEYFGSVFINEDKLFPYVRKEQLSQLPFPDLTPPMAEILEKLAKQRSEFPSGTKRANEIESQIDATVKRAFNI
ncbi:MAG: TaqI-like C-terminal specificity domain-containing protein [Pyrinomonadaceae bacterium]